MIVCYVYLPKMIAYFSLYAICKRLSISDNVTMTDSDFLFCYLTAAFSAVLGPVYCAALWQ